jgi:hypothetical protein
MTGANRGSFRRRLRNIWGSGQGKNEQQAESGQKGEQLEAKHFPDDSTQTATDSLSKQDQKDRQDLSVLNPAGDLVKRLLAVFNSSEHPAAMAGIARSLGIPKITIHLGRSDSATILVAWELCWYSFDVDLRAGHGGAGEVKTVNRGYDQCEQPINSTHIATASINEHGLLLQAEVIEARSSS